MRCSPRAAGLPGVMVQAHRARPALPARPASATRVRAQPGGGQAWRNYRRDMRSMRRLWVAAIPVKLNAIDPYHPQAAPAMQQKKPKTAVVAFKIESELADFLNQLPNKSAFIRKAIAAQMSTACPLCNGTGQVSRWTHEHYVPLLASWNARPCDGCGHEMSLPEEAG